VTRSVRWTPGSKNSTCGFADGNFGGREVEALAMFAAGHDPVVPELKKLVVRHCSELRGPDLEVVRRDDRVGVLDDRGVAVARDST
jgi:hypothetical protein